MGVMKSLAAAAAAAIKGVSWHQAGDSGAGARSNKGWVGEGERGGVPGAKDFMHCICNLYQEDGHACIIGVPKIKAVKHSYSGEIIACTGC